MVDGGFSDLEAFPSLVILATRTEKEHFFNTLYKLNVFYASNYIEIFESKKYVQLLIKFNSYFIIRIYKFVE